MKERAFTLIELLVAVAILAILASIAIPHARNALLKSKIARAHADMEAIHQAFMMKIIDRNRKCELGSIFCGGYRDLTTPVAYLSSVERAYDVFGKHTMDRNPENLEENQIVPLEYLYKGGLCYQYFWGLLEFPFYIERNSSDFQWPEYRISFGPDEIFQYGLVGQLKVPYMFFNRIDVYQPSNGLISAGDLVVCNYELDRILVDIDKPEF